MRLEFVRWPELAALKERTFVVPLGSLEQHGPHLPVWVDSCINECLLDRALAALPLGMPVLALPLQAHSGLIALFAMIGGLSALLAEVGG